MTPDKLDAAKKSWCGAAHSLSFLTLHVTSEISTSFFTSIELVSKSFSAKNDFWFSDKESKLDFLSYIFSVSEEYKDYTFDYDDMAG